MGRARAIFSSGAGLGLLLLVLTLGGAGCVRRPVVRVRVEDATQSIFLARMVRLFPEEGEAAPVHEIAMDEEGVGELALSLSEATFFRLEMGEERGRLDVLLSPLDSLRVCIAADGSVEAKGSAETLRWHGLLQRYEAYRDSLRVLSGLYATVDGKPGCDSLRLLYLGCRGGLVEDMRSYLLSVINGALYSKLAVPALLAERDSGEAFFGLVRDSALFGRVLAAHREVYSERAYLARLDSALSLLGRARSQGERDSLLVGLPDSAGNTAGVGATSVQTLGGDE